MSVRRRTDTGRWQARYKDPAGTWRAKDFDRKADASAWLGQQKQRVREQDWSDPNAAKVLVRDMYPIWLNSRALKPKTRADYEGLWRNCVEPTWGSVRLDRITLPAVATWVNTMTANREARSCEGSSPEPRALSASRKRQAYNVLAGILDAAVAEGRLRRNPARAVVSAGQKSRLLPPTSTRKAHRYLTHGEVQAVAEAAGDYSTLIYLLAFTGLRWGEAVALRVHDVDPLRSRVRVQRSMYEVHGVIGFGPPKTHQAREVAMPSFLRDDVTELMAGKGRDDLLFTSPQGDPLRLPNFRQRVFDKAVRRAGVDRLTPHDLRHTAASLAVSSGANVKAVQRMLGHASATMTLDTYSGLFDGDLEAVADRLDRAFRASAQGASDSDRTGHRPIRASHLDDAAS